MRRLLHAFLLLAIGLPVALGDAAPRGLAHLLRARNELGNAHWSAIVQLTRDDPHRPTEDALVFEFADALWFYRPADGTQSLSRHWNNIAHERLQLLVLLQDIDPACTAWREYRVAELETLAPSAGELPNGCFIQSAAEARRLSRTTGRLEGCLLSYYVETSEGQRGHTVLCYNNDDGTQVYDPADGSTTAVRSLSLREKAMSLARVIVPKVLLRGLTKAAMIAVR